MAEIGDTNGTQAEQLFTALLKHPLAMVRSIAREVLMDIDTPTAQAAAESAKTTPEQQQIQRDALRAHVAKLRNQSNQDSDEQ